MASASEHTAIANQLMPGHRLLGALCYVVLVVAKEGSEESWNRTHVRGEGTAFPYELDWELISVPASGFK